MAEQALAQTSAFEYSPHFFQERATGAERSAANILPLVWRYITPKSVVDLGCGIGNWLNVCRGMGVERILGFDGDYVDISALQIPADRFIPADLAKPVQCEEHFDMAICLEVAEHLPETSAPTLVESLVRLADVILFSAAIPGQTGTNHINEQWPEFWAELFGRHGYSAVDSLRDAVWEDETVEPWYAQNAMLFVKDTLRRQSDGFRNVPVVAVPQRRVHPKIFFNANQRFDDLQSLRTTPECGWAFRALGVTLVRRGGEFFNRVVRAIKRRMSPTK